MYFDCISRYRGGFRTKASNIAGSVFGNPFPPFFTFNTELTAKKKGTK